MTREQILQYMRATPNVGVVKHEEFTDYVLTLSHRKKTDEGWQSVETPYMTVDGKLAMANQDHLRQGKQLEFHPPQVLVDTEEQLTLMVTVTSELYGTRHGIATSRRVGGAEIERLFSWEVAETSAIGRALSAMGYGLFPGSGLASAEDMLRATAEQTKNNNANTERRVAPDADNWRGATNAAAAPQRGANETRPSYGRTHPPLSPVQRNKLTELWRMLYGDAAGDAAEGLERLFVEAYKHGMNEATYEEGARLTGQLLSELRNKTQAH